MRFLVLVGSHFLRTDWQKPSHRFTGLQYGEYSRFVFSASLGCLRLTKRFTSWQHAEDSTEKKIKNNRFKLSRYNLKQLDFIPSALKYIKFKIDCDDKLRAIVHKALGNFSNFLNIINKSLTPIDFLRNLYYFFYSEYRLRFHIYVFLAWTYFGLNQLTYLIPKQCSMASKIIK